MRLSVYSSSADSAPAPPPMEPEVTVTITGGSGMLRERGWMEREKVHGFFLLLV